MKELEKLLTRMEAAEQRAFAAEARVKQLEAQVAASGAGVPAIGQHSQALPPPLPLPTNASSPVAVVGLVPAGGGARGAAGAAGGAGAAGATGGVARVEVGTPATFYGLLDKVENSSLRAKTRERCDMCTYVFVCVCICMYACMYVCMCTYVRTYMHIHLIYIYGCALSRATLGTQENVFS